MEALLDLEGCNQDVSSSGTTSDGIEGTVTADLMVTAETEADALGKSLVIVRTAIHAIGGATLGWERDDAEARYQPRNSQLEYV